MARKKKISVEELDQKFDDGEEVLEHLDTHSIRRPNKVQRISLDIPEWMLLMLDHEATRLGIPRQAVIKVMLDDSLKKRA
jgi:predicted DNA binding CopG/RHH family protein